MTNIWARRRGAIAAFAAVSMTLLTGSAQAESNKVRIATSFGLLYLPLQVAVERKLIEKHASELGVPEVEVSFLQIYGGGNLNTALLSGNVDLVTAGVPPLLKLWDRTKGTDQEVRGMLSLSHSPYVLYTNDNRVTTITDYRGLRDHRIGVPGVQTSTQAVTLQMAAAKAFGITNATSLDEITMALPHPQAVASLLANQGAVRSHFATLPFSHTLAKAPNVKAVFSSYDLIGPHTGIVVYNTKKWKVDNPRLFEAVSAALLEAQEWIHKNPAEAARVYKKFSEAKESLSELEEIISDKAQIEYRADTRGTLVYAHFLNDIGAMKNRASSWQDYFWDSAYKWPGN